MCTKLVLVVDDVDDNAVLWRTILEHNRYRARVACDGEECLRLVREERPDLILMDLAMPRMDGWMATKLLKEDPETATIPILIVTAHAHPEARVRAEAAGCDGFIVTPCEPRLLAVEVQRVIGPARMPAG